MILHSRYKLLDPLKVDEFQTFRGFHVRLGHELMVHFQREPDERKVQFLFEQLSRLGDADKRLFIDAGEFDGQPYVVTWPLQEFDGLGKWLRDRANRPKQALPKLPGAPAASVGVKPHEPPLAPVAPVASAPVATPHPSAASPAPIAGEFTMFFGGKLEAESSTPPGTQSHPETRAQSEPVRPEADESTRLLSSLDAAPSAPVAPRVTPAPRSGPAAKGSGAGEFTMMFAPELGSAPTARPGQPAPPEPTVGELTAFLKQSGTPQTPVASPPAPGHAPSSPVSAGTAGEFTMFFAPERGGQERGAPERGVQERSAPAPGRPAMAEPQVGELTAFLRQSEVPQRFGSPAPGMTPTPKPGPGAPPAGPNISNGPDEYSMLFGSKPGMAAAPSTPVAQPAPPAPAQPQISVSLPTVSLPSTPSMPSAPSVPSMPSAPTVSGLPQASIPTSVTVPVAKPASDKTILIAASAALALIAVLIVVYFVIRS